MPLNEKDIAPLELPKQRCVKCGNTEDFNFVYIDQELIGGFNVGYKDVEPYLRFACRSCQYIWKVEPLDK